MTKGWGPGGGAGYCSKHVVQGKTDRIIVGKETLEMMLSIHVRLIEMLDESDYCY
jgi:hypothetical protein